VGMCGPLMLALPLDAAGKRRVLVQMLTYHSGRILSYAALGVLFGLLGKGIFLAGLQKSLSVGAGILMLVMAFAAWRFEQLVLNLPGFDTFTARIKTGIAKRLRKNTASAVFGVGALNGFLPCGMVYAALAGAISTTEAAEGGLFMALFGLGTLPMMLAVGVAGRSLGFSFRQKLRFAQPLLLTLAGLLLLQRGLHLDLSLFESAVPKPGYQCH
jgi:uncharacterized protein